ncbi:hypothetical protein [Streptomyces capitiformicae]|uniref:Uncharacterized protein n=1 Tax=Streptomyces capitiformicae TaxID=2014920 RepID=A0A919GPM3_9ACTN|nr:hypothetical protein [Streptomyces capitiformicae]GHH87918.1 hypothetical protein GCM10017771_31070 [Streptomyces capitiformicae]
MNLGLLPIRLGLLDRPPRKHRAVDEVERQKGMRAGADRLIQALRLQLEDQDLAHAEVIARIDARHAEVVDGMQRQIDDLRRRLDIACKAETAVTKTQELSVDEIRQHCIKPVPLHLSPMARRDPAHVPAWAHRDEPEPAA